MMIFSCIVFNLLDGKYESASVLGLIKRVLLGLLSPFVPKKFQRKNMRKIFWEILVSFKLDFVPYLCCTTEALAPRQTSGNGLQPMVTLS